jgi:hypothetical protein
MEIMARKVSKNKNSFKFTDYQGNIKLHGAESFLKS